MKCIILTLYKIKVLNIKTVVAINFILGGIMDNQFSYVQSITNTDNLQKNAERKLEIINLLLNETIAEEKLSIIQSVLNEIDKNTEVTKNINPKLKAGTVVADRFKEMSPEVKKIVEENIRSIKPEDLKHNDIILFSGSNVINEPKRLDKIDCTREFPILCDREHVINLLINMNQGYIDTSEDMFKAIEAYEKGEPFELIIPAKNLPGYESKDPEEFIFSRYKYDITNNTSLTLKIHSIKCLRKLHRIMSDKISIGCATIDDKNTYEIIDEFNVDKNFNVNDIISYNDPKTLKLFSLDSYYPKVFSAYILLIEKSNTSINKFISGFFNAIKGDIGEISAELLKLAGVDMGFIGTKLIDELAPPAIDCLISWCSNVLKNDMFPAIQIHAPFNSVPIGQIKSPIETLTFKFNTAEYEVCCSWEVTQTEENQLPVDANLHSAMIRLQQIDGLPGPDQIVIFYVNPYLIKSPVPLGNPYLIGKVCSIEHIANETSPGLKVEIWFGGFSMIEVTIPKSAIYEWRDLPTCFISRNPGNN